MADKILLVDACVRAESRTRRLAETALEKTAGDVERVSLRNHPVEPLNEATLNERTRLLEKEEYDAPMLSHARQFAAADEIIVAAPYWDMAFPACLKAYLEAITVAGITFRYNKMGIPVGLCRSKRLIYIATAGGLIYGENLGFTYVKGLAQDFYGIEDVRYFDAQGLDIIGADVEAIMAGAAKKIAEEL